MGDIATLISSVGFPIAACVAMGYFCKYTIDVNREQINCIQEKHHNEMVGITEALNNNTLALQKLCEKMEESHDRSE